MKTIELLRYLKGYVTFEGVGGFTERFINLCSVNGVFIWDVSISDNRLKAKCKCNDYKKLRNIAKKSGVHLSLREKSGFIFDLNSRKDRAGLLVGALFFLLFFTVMSRFVWTVDVAGNVNFSKEDILLQGENQGLFVGTYKPLFNEVMAANEIAQNSDGAFSWAAINIKGCKAVIEVREQKKSIKDSTEKKPCNLISNFDGMIISSEVFSGTGNIFTGNGVKKGDLLISGVEENEDMSVSFVEADGKITAKGEKAFGLSFKKKANVKSICNIKKSYSLFIFGINLPLGLPGTSREMMFSEKSFLSYNSVRLPIGITVKTSCNSQSKARSEKELLLSSLEKFSNECYNLNRNTLILNENLDFSQDVQSINFKNSWECLEFIGEKQEIQTET